MAESAREGQSAQKQTGGPNESGRDGGAATQLERGSKAGQEQAERIAKLGNDQMRQAADASTAAVGEMVNSGSAVAGGAQEITAAWARYAEEVLRHTSEATQELLRARTLTDMLEVQAKLLRSNMQAFLDQTATIADAASRMAARPFEAFKNAASDQPRR
jgi:hypothetical protein